MLLLCRGSVTELNFCVAAVCELCSYGSRYIAPGTVTIRTAVRASVPSAPRRSRPSHRMPHTAMVPPSGTEPPAKGAFIHGAVRTRFNVVNFRLGARHIEAPPGLLTKFAAHSQCSSSTLRERRQPSTTEHRSVILFVLRISGRAAVCGTPPIHRLCGLPQR